MLQRFYTFHLHILDLSYAVQVHPYLCFMDTVETCADVVCEDACLYGLGSPFFEQQRVEEFSNDLGVTKE